MKVNSSLLQVSEMSDVDSSPPLSGEVSADVLFQKAATEAGRRELAGLPTEVRARIGTRIAENDLNFPSNFYAHLVSSNDGLKFLNQIIASKKVVQAVADSHFNIELEDIVKLADLDEGTTFFNHVLHSENATSLLGALGQKNGRDQLLQQLSNTVSGRLFLCNIDFRELSLLVDGKLFSPLSQETLNALLSDEPGVAALSDILEEYPKEGYEKIFRDKVKIDAGQFSRLLNMKLQPVMADDGLEYSNDYILRPAYGLIKSLLTSQSFDRLVMRDARFTNEQFGDFISATRNHRSEDDFNLRSLYGFEDRRESLLRDVVLTPKTLFANSNLQKKLTHLSAFQQEKYQNSFGAQRFDHLLQAVVGLLTTNIDENYKLNKGSVAAAFRSGPVSDDARWLGALTQANCLWQVLSEKHPIELSVGHMLNAMSNMTKVRALTGLVETGRGHGVNFPEGAVRVSEEKLIELFGHEDDEAKDPRNRRPGVRLLGALAHEGMLQLEAPLTVEELDSYFVSLGLYQGFVGAMIGSGRKEALRPVMQQSRSPVFAYVAGADRPVGATSDDEALRTHLVGKLLSHGVNRDRQQVKFMDGSGFVALAADAAQGNVDSTRYINWFLRSDEPQVVTIRKNTLERLTVDGLSALIVFAPDAARQVLERDELAYVQDRGAFRLSRRAMEKVGTWPQEVCDHFTPIQFGSMATTLATHPCLLNLFAENQPRLLQRMCEYLQATSPIVGPGTQHYEALTANALSQLASAPQTRIAFLENASQRQIQAIPYQAFKDMPPAALNDFSEGEGVNPFFRALTEPQLSAMLAPDGRGALHRVLFNQPRPLLSAGLINSFNPRVLANALIRHGITDIGYPLFELMNDSLRQKLLAGRVQVQEHFVPPTRKQRHANEVA